MIMNTSDIYYWRHRAEHMRGVASSIGDLSTRRKIEDIAETCDKMAEWIRRGGTIQQSRMISGAANSAAATQQH
jgi:hypothetical protein